MKKTIRVFSFSLIGLFFLIESCLAGQVIGTVGVVRGDAFFIINKKSQKIEPNSNIEEKGSVEVKEGGFVKILMIDDTVITVNEKSKIGFDEFKFESKKDRKSTYSLDAGKVRALVTKKLRTGHINLKTKTVTMGVRGTEFLVNSFEKNGVPQTDILLLSGKLTIDVKDLKIPNAKETTMQAGQFLSTVDMRDSQSVNVIKKVDPKFSKELKESPESFLPDKLMNEGGVLKGNINVNLLRRIKTKSSNSDESNATIKQFKTQESKVIVPVDVPVISNVDSTVDKANESVQKTEQAIDKSTKQQIEERLKDAVIDADDSVKEIIERTLQNNQ